MIHLRLSYTVRSPHPSSEWTLVHEETRRFANIHDARAALKEQYSHVKKRLPVYVDTKSRGVIQCGYIYCYKDVRDICHGDMRTVYCQDWVHFYDVQPLPEPSRTINVRRKEG